MYTHHADKGGRPLHLGSVRAAKSMCGLIGSSGRGGVFTASSFSLIIQVPLLKKQRHGPGLFYIILIFIHGSTLQKRQMHFY